MQQRFEVALARGAHRGDDAAAFPGDLFVGHAIQTCFPFVAAIACIHDMRVAIDQAWREPAALRVMFLSYLDAGGKLAALAEPNDLAVTSGDGSVMDFAITLPLLHGGKIHVDPKIVPVMTGLTHGVLEWLAMRV